MHVRDFLYQPINFSLFTVVVTLYGLVVVSAVLQNAGLPDPVGGFGEMIAEKLIT